MKKHGHMECDMTPLAYALANHPVRENLINTLIANGADVHHPSVTEVIKIVEADKESLDDPEFGPRKALDIALKARERKEVPVVKASEPANASQHNVTPNITEERLRNAEQVAHQLLLSAVAPFHSGNITEKIKNETPEEAIARMFALGIGSATLLMIEAIRRKNNPAPTPPENKEVATKSIPAPKPEAPNPQPHVRNIAPAAPRPQTFSGGMGVEATKEFTRVLKESEAALGLNNQPTSPENQDRVKDAIYSANAPERTTSRNAIEPKPAESNSTTNVGGFPIPSPIERVNATANLITQRPDTNAMIKNIVAKFEASRSGVENNSGMVRK
jgi:hypothetical protein